MKIAIKFHEKINKYQVHISPLDNNEPEIHLFGFQDDDLVEDIKKAITQVKNGPETRSYMIEAKLDQEIRAVINKKYQTRNW